MMIRMNYRCKKGTVSPDSHECPKKETGTQEKREVKYKTLRDGPSGEGKSAGGDDFAQFVKKGLREKIEDMDDRRFNLVTIAVERELRRRGLI